MPKLATDQMDPRNNLEWYTKEAITNNAEVWTPQMIRREYSRLRDIAQKRLSRLAVAEPGSYAYRKNVGQYAPARGQTTEALAAKLPQLARFIAAKTGSVRGIRAQRAAAVRTLQERGYTGVTTANIKEFGEFMEHYRDNKVTHSIGSPEAVEVFEFYQEQGIPWKKVKEDFAAWVRAKGKLETYIKKQNAKGREVSADDLIKEFNKQEAARKKRNEQQRKRRKQKKQGGEAG
jgi:hypothetical protein